MEQASKGSILKFLAVGVLLAGLLVGGAYMLKTPSAMKPVTPGVGAPEQPADPPVEPPTEEVVPPVAESSPSEPPVTELPTTGPQHTLGALIVVGLLAGSMAGYLRSRRPQLSL